MRRVAVVGAGVTKFGKHERTCAELFAEAAVDALRDADIAPGRIQGIYVGNVVGEAGERQLHMGPQVASTLGIPGVAATWSAVPSESSRCRPTAPRRSSPTPPTPRSSSRPG